MKRLEHAAELLDATRHDPVELEQSLQHLAAVNRWLGGTRALLHHISPLLRPEATTRLLDVGTGSADIPRRIVSYARARACSVEIVATDVHPQMVQIAAHKCAAYPEITVMQADALALQFESKSFQSAMMSLTLHHFESEQQVRVLRELARVSTQSVLVNELARSQLNYAGARLLAVTLWRGNRLTRHDGPLSVRRAFTSNELRALAERAGLTAKVHHHFFQRLVLVATPVSAGR